MLKLIIVVTSATMASVLLAFMAGAEVGKRPSTPLVAVKEIDPNWITISVVRGVGQNDAWDGQQHPAQANALGAFVCKLYDRTAVSLSLFGGPLTRNIYGQPMRQPYPIMKNSYYLFACAVE